MSFVSIVLGFALGLLFLIVGALSVLAGQWVGLFLLGIALLLLPPVRYLVHQRTGRRITAVMRTFLVSVLLGLFVIFMDYFADSVEGELSSYSMLIESARTAD